MSELTHPPAQGADRCARLCYGLMITTALVSMSTMAFAQSQSASAQPPATPANGVETIVVTAQRRTENLQSVPLTVKAISSRALAQQNITTALEINKLVPAVSLAPSSGTVELYIRGIGNNVDSQGNEPSNALYVDGVYYSRLLPSLFRLNNVDQIEVLKGPQGTLFGRNAEGGLVQILTKNPVPGSKPSGEVSVGYGSFHTNQESAYISGGLTDKLAADLAINDYNNPGFGRNVYNNRKAIYEQSFDLRSKLVYEPFAGTRVIIEGDYIKANSDLGLQTPTPGGPKAGLGNTGYPDGSGLLPHIGYYDINVDVPRNTSAEEYGSHITIEQDVGFAKLVSITAYHRVNESYVLDPDFGPTPGYSVSLPGYNRQFTQELQLQSKPGSPFDWTAGVFYLNINQGYKYAYLNSPTLGLPPGDALIFYSRAPVRSYAGYGQATFKIMPKLKLTLGARASDDDIGGDGSIDFSYGPGSFNLVPYASARTASSRLTGKVVLSYQLADQVLTYLSASRGYKSGLYNLLTFSPTYIKPEVLDAFEIGAKSELFDSKLRLNAAAFDEEFNSPQEQIVSMAGLLNLVNANGARITGFDFDSEWVPINNLTLILSGSYLHSEFTDYKNAPFYTPNPNPPYGLLVASGNADGNDLPRAPKFAGNVGFNYRIPFHDARWVISGNYAYTGSFYWTPDNHVEQKSYGLLDGRLAYEMNNGVSVSLWGSNLTGEKYLTSAQHDAGFAGDLAAPGPPRQYGVKVDYKF